MARTDNDSWEITESVGATALGVASARAAETRNENPLITDPFAQVFLDAAGDGVWNWHSAGQLPDEVIEAEPTLPLQMQSMVGYMASRTAFFDRFFLDATRAGIRQAVILAAGLDARSWRLDWPAGTTVYELDQTRVLDFKASTLAEHGADVLKITGAHLPNLGYQEFDTGHGKLSAQLDLREPRDVETLLGLVRQADR